MIEKIDTSQFQEPLEKPSSKKSGSVNPVQTNDADASLQVNHASLIEQAMQPLQTDDEVVQRARKLLESGQLECPENVLEATRNIIKLGI